MRLGDRARPTVREVVRTVQANVGGVEAGRLRQGGEEFPIVVRLTPADRLGSEDLTNIAPRTPAGAIVPLAAVVERQRARGPVEIERIDGQRITYVTATHCAADRNDAEHAERHGPGDLKNAEPRKQE